MNPYWAGGVSNQQIGEELKVDHTDQVAPEGEHKIGTRAWTDDGRVFYYASNGTGALTHGLVCLSAALLTGHDLIVATATGIISAGTRLIKLDETDVESSDAIAGYYNGGYLHASASTGLGQYRRVKRQQALDNTATATKDIELWDAIETASAATTNWVLTPNPYQRAIASTTATVEAQIGVAPTNVTASGAVPTDVTATANDISTYFFWMQTYGPCAVLYSTDSATPGDPVRGGSDVGSLEEWTNTGGTGIEVQAMPLGRTLSGAAGAGDGEYLLIDLRIRS